MSQWDEDERAAETMIPLIGNLYRDRAVEISVFGNLMVKRAVNDILKAHEFAREVANAELSPRDTLQIVEVLRQLPVRSAHIDIGKLVVKYRTQGSGQSPRDFLDSELASAYLTDSAFDAPTTRPQKDVVLYGFGRIGRLLARLLGDQTGGGRGMRLRAIVVRKGKGNDLDKRASLLRFDSVHGPFKGVVRIDESASAMLVNGQRIKVIYADSPESVDYAAHGIDNAVLVDNTGVWRDNEGLSRHLRAGGISQVLLTAPGKGEIKNIVHGINHSMITEDDRILSAASCTTNAIAPIIKSIHDKFGILNGHMETVHAYTNDQNLIDNYHKANRRGRSAPLNIVLTETGAAKAVAKALPEMTGRLSGSSVRVPTANVSMAVLALNLETATTRDEINDYMRYIAMHSNLQKQVGYSNSPEAVSTDFVGSRSAGIFDALATFGEDRRCVLYVWYDNEYGYACQVVRILRQMTHSTLPVYPAEN